MAKATPVEVPPMGVTATVSPTALRDALMAAHREVGDLRAAAERLRVERDQAIRSSGALRADAEHEVRTLRQELKAALADAERARTAQRAVEQRAVANLDKYHGQISALEERVAAARRLMALLHPDLLEHDTTGFLDDEVTAPGIEASDPPVIRRA